MKSRILVVDDDVNITNLLSRHLTEWGYEPIIANRAYEALKIAFDTEVDLILTDIRMPELDGLELMRQVKILKKEVPVIMLTALRGEELLREAIKEGAYDFLAKPFDENELEASIKMALERRQPVLESRGVWRELHLSVQEKNEQLSRAFEHMSQTYKALKDAHLETIYRLCSAAEYKDPDTGQHLKRISGYTGIIARKLYLPPGDVEVLEAAAPMHDIGKVGIPEAILQKPGKLDPDEWEVMKTHTLIGSKILESSQSDILKVGQVIALNHHERYDGTGYPQGLREEAIPIEARIVTVADVFDAITSKRCYHPPQSVETAMEYILSTSGNHFDPKVVEAFMGSLDEITEVKEAHPEMLKV